MSKLYSFSGSLICLTFFYQLESYLETEFDPSMPSDWSFFHPGSALLSSLCAEKSEDSLHE